MRGQIWDVKFRQTYVVPVKFARGVPDPIERASIPEPQKTTEAE